MDGPESVGWQIHEEHSYTAAAEQIGTRQIDDALNYLMFALRRNPLGFSLVPGFSDIRFAQTKMHISDGEVTPAFTVWFRATEPAKSVALLYIEYSQPEDMSYTDDWF